MVKIFFIIYAFSVVLLADRVENFASSLMGQEEYKKKEKFVNILINENRSSLVQDGEINLIALASLLKTNGFLNLYQKEPRIISVEFKINRGAIAVVKNITDSLHSLGFGYFLTKKIVYENETLNFIIEFKSEYDIEPDRFLKDLQKKGCKAIFVEKKKEGEWIYELGCESVKIPALIYEQKPIEVKKPIEAIWVDVENFDAITINANPSDYWKPNIVFFDKNLKILNFERIDEKTNVYKSQIPNFVKYVKIDDIYTLENIKRGLTIHLK